MAQLFDTPFVMLYSSQMASGLLTYLKQRPWARLRLAGNSGLLNRPIEKGHCIPTKGFGMCCGTIDCCLERSSRSILAGPSPPRFVQAVNLEDYIPCPTNGIWEPTVDLGVDVKEGDLLGRLHDFSDHSSEPLEIRSHQSGVVLMLHFAAQCRKGATLYVIAQEVHL